MQSTSEQLLAEGEARAQAVEPAGSGGAQRNAARFGRALARFVKEYAIVVVVVVMFIVLAATSDVFLTWTNISNILEQIAPIGLLAGALTFVTIAGEFDLSAGAIAVLIGIIAGKLQPLVGTWPSLGLAVVCAIGFGLINGTIIQKARINSFVTTLATSLILAGIGLVITGGFLVTVAEPSFADLGSGSFLGLQWSVYLLIAFFVLGSLILSRTTFGRWLYAVGGNPEAARLSGVSVQRVKIIVFGISGLAAGIAGAVLVSRTGTGQSGDGITQTLAAFAAVVVGGTSLRGGQGSLWRTALGVVFLGLITNAFNLLAIDPIYQSIVQGAIVLVAVGADALTRRRAG